MESNKELTIKGLPMYLVALFESITQMLPVFILWLTFLYGIVQLWLVSCQLLKEFKNRKKEDKNETANKNSDDD